MAHKWRRLLCLCCNKKWASTSDQDLEVEKAPKISRILWKHKQTNNHHLITLHWHNHVINMPRKVHKRSWISIIDYIQVYMRYQHFNDGIFFLGRCWFQMTRNPGRYQGVIVPRLLACLVKHDLRNWHPMCHWRSCASNPYVGRGDLNQFYLILHWTFNSTHCHEAALSKSRCRFWSLMRKPEVAISIKTPL